MLQGALVVDEKGMTAFDVADQQFTPEATKAARRLHAEAKEGWVVLELTHEQGLSRPFPINGSSGGGGGDGHYPK
jgi:hypothetical protein